MNFSSPLFIFFIAFALWGFSFCGERARRWYLLILGLFWYGTWRPEWPLYLSILVGLNYCLLRTKRTNRFKILVVMNVAVLIVLKALPYSSDRFKFQSPYGSSFLIFILISSVIDHSRALKVKETEFDFCDFFLSVAFFPMIVAGPIERSSHLLPQIKKLTSLKIAALVDGGLIFALGFSKQFFLSRPLFSVTSAWHSSGKLGLWGMLALGLVSPFQIYLDLSAYCDMARGVARCFEIELLPNFTPFYYATDPNDFWKRWNITLGTWIRDYFTIPILLKFGRSINRYVIVALAFLIIGLWHGLTWNYLSLGILDGSLIILFLSMKNGLLLRRPKLSRLLGIGLVFLLYWGNGILQLDDGLTLLKNMFLTPSSDFTEKFLNLFSERYLLSSLLILFVLEFWQVKSKNLDFFLKFPAVAKSCALLVLIVFFLVALQSGWFEQFSLTEPTYFRF